MKILFNPIEQGALVHGHRTWAEYGTDSLFHGLRSVLGDCVVERRRMWHMYAADKSTALGGEFERLWGRGFTLYGLLPDDSGVDRWHIDHKLETGFFDLVVATVHCSAADPHQKGWVCEQVEDLVRQARGRPVAFVDTLDAGGINYPSLKGKVAAYFRRELADGDDALPFGYSIPKEKFVSEPKAKTQGFAHPDPRDPKTYTYRHEADYYEAYAVARYAHTCKKGGWDCMRHYEILACGSMPYFHGLTTCPKRTLAAFPKDAVLRAMALPGVSHHGHVDEAFFSQAGYEESLEEVFNYARCHLTTEAAAVRFLDFVRAQRA